MSNLLNKAPLFDVRGDFDYVASPVFLDTELHLVRPERILRYSEQSFAYVQPSSPLITSRSNVSVSVFLSRATIGGSPNIIQKSEHSLRVI